MKTLKYFGVLALALIFGSCEKTDEDFAKEAFENYAEAIEDKNYEKAAKLICRDGVPLTDEEAESEANMMNLFYPISGLECELVKFEYDDSDKEASVTYNLISRDNEEEQKKEFVKVVKCGDAWYIEE